jgi:predicted ATPase/DNA-binding winged helix-turn-helix (wHTH) protein
MSASPPPRSRSPIRAADSSLVGGEAISPEDAADPAVYWMTEAGVAKVSGPMVDPPRTHTDDAFLFGPFRLSAAARRLDRSGVRVQLGDRALDTLIVLLNHAGEVVDKRDLVDQVWPNVHVEESSLRHNIAVVRGALGDSDLSPHYVQNVWGRGYCFTAPVVRESSFDKPAQARPTPRSIDGLPSRLTRMVGREETTADLVAQVLRQRFVSIVGPGGMGKTTLAVAVGCDAAESLGAVCFVDLGPLSDPALLPLSLANALGLTVESDALISLIAFLRERRILLILDGCEHVIEAAATIADQIMRSAPQVHILATSREPIRVEGEHVHRLSPLGYPDEDSGLTAEHALTFPAIQLLIDRATAANHRFALSDADARLASEICRRLDGMALAIELAAARVGAIGMAETAALLDSKFVLRWTGRRKTIGRHHTISAAIDWSYAVLPDVESLVLRRLSIFVGVFSMAAAQFVASDASVDEEAVAEALSELVAKSLVAADLTRTETRYRLLDTTRAHVRSKLIEAAEFDGPARRHAQYFLQLLEGPKGDISTDIEFGAAPAHRDHLGNLRAALEWSFSPSGDGEVGASLAAAAAPTFMGLYLWAECDRWTGHAIAVCANEESPRVLALLTANAQAKLLLDRPHSDVQTGLMKARELAHALGDTHSELTALLGLHRYYANQNNDYAQSLRIAEQMSSVASRAAEYEVSALADFTIGISHHFLGNQALACSYHESGLRRALGRLSPSAALTSDIGNFRASVCYSRALWLNGRPDKAILTAKETLARAEDLKKKGVFSLCAIWAIQVFTWVQDWPGARSIAESLLDLTENHPQTSLRELSLAIQGELLVRTGDANAGVPLLRNYLSIVEKAGGSSLMPTVALVEGCMALGDFASARRTLEAAIPAAERHGYLMYMPEMLRLRGEIVSAEGRTPEVEPCFLDAMALAHQQSSPSWELRAACSLAGVQAARGEVELAAQTVAAVYRRFSEGFDTPDLRTAQRLSRTAPDRRQPAHLTPI